jgi:hypothetical protein
MLPGQHDFGFEQVAPRGITWDRYGDGKNKLGLRYQMKIGGVSVDVWVCHCGHPTANRPYYIEVQGAMLRLAYRHLAEAQAIAVKAFTTGRDPHALPKDDRPLDIGLWSEERNQTDIVDLTRSKERHPRRSPVNY